MEVQRVKRLALQVALPRDVLPVADDVGVVFAELVIRHRTALGGFGKTGYELLHELRSAVFRPTLELGSPKHLRQSVEVIDAELFQYPRSQQQFVGKVARHQLRLSKLVVSNMRR